MTKSLSAGEIKSFASQVDQILEGAQLQNVLSDGRLVVFELYKYQSYFLCVDTMVPQPYIFLTLEKPVRFKKANKPLTLFCNSHLKNLHWKHLKFEDHKGRYLALTIVGGPKVATVEFVLIPRVFNLLVCVQEEGEKTKKIAWNKPADLAVSTLPVVETPVNLNDLPPLWSEYSSYFGDGRDIRKTSAEIPDEKTDLEKKINQEISKREKAIASIKKSLDVSVIGDYQKLGESLVLKNIPVYLKHLYKTEFSMSENKDRAFQKVKEFKNKVIGAESRVIELEKQIEKIKSTRELPSARKNSGKNAPKSVAGKKDDFGFKARKLDLAAETVVYMGKSAADNLAILRKSRAWDIWLHLKDYPSAHAVIFKSKNQELTSAQLNKVCEWFIKESKTIKDPKPGDRIEFILCECRFVKPIKGDKAGRVNYQNQKNINFQIKNF